MAAPGEPPTSTQTEPDASPPQTADTTVPDRIPLPPPTTAPPQAPPRRRRSWLDAFLVLLVVGFAFLVASTPAHNSDLWLHLATGRALVHGQYHFGVDPFAQGTEHVYWANTNWLYDVLTYAVFQGFGALGGAALVLLKAVLVGVLALILARLGWCGRGLWAPAVGAAWAVLALSPWLMLHPMIVSYLFLALTIYFLERPHRPAPEDDLFAAKPVSFIAYWPLLPLFALWANLDAWFLLGPLTVALYLIGQVLQTKFGPDRDGRAVGKGETAALGLALPACLAACLLNPHGVYAFLTPPAQLGLSPAAHVLEQDAAFQGLRLSPFQSAYYYNRARLDRGRPGVLPVGFTRRPVVRRQLRRLALAARPGLAGVVPARRPAGPGRPVLRRRGRAAAGAERPGVPGPPLRQLDAWRRGGALGRGRARAVPAWRPRPSRGSLVGVAARGAIRTAALGGGSRSLHPEHGRNDRPVARAGASRRRRPRL